MRILEFYQMGGKLITKKYGQGFHMYGLHPASSIGQQMIQLSRGSSLLTMKMEESINRSFDGLE